MTNENHGLTHEHLLAAQAGIEFGRKSSDALLEVNILIATSSAARMGLRPDNAEDEEIAAAVAFGLGVVLRTNAIVQILAPIVAEMAEKHKALGHTCIDECAEDLLQRCLSGAVAAAISQGKAMHDANERDDAAQAMMADPDVLSSGAAKDAERKLAELMATLGKGH